MFYRMSTFRYSALIVLTIQKVNQNVNVARVITILNKLLTRIKKSQTHNYHRSKVMGTYFGEVEI